MLKLLILSVSLLLYFQKSFAQQSVPDLDPVTITASLAPEKASKTGRNLFIIKGDYFNNLPVHSIDELLRYLPGIEVQARGPMGSQSDIVLRGGTFQQVLVILDGTRLNDPNTGHFSSYIPIAPAEIERIEILKGASSAIYGSEAVGGVIHIITKTFEAKRDVKKTNASAHITGGSYGLWNASAGGFTGNGKTSFGGGIVTNNANGPSQRGTTGFFHNNTISASINHYFNEHWQLALRSSYDDRRFSAQNFYTNFISDTASEKVKTSWNQLQLTHSTQGNKIRLNAGYKILNDHFVFNPSSLPNQNKTKLVQALLIDEWKLKSKTTIVSGVQFITKMIRSNDRGNHHLRQTAAFVNFNQQLGRNFFASPAARIEWNERSGWELVPQINLAFRTSKLQLRASAGKTTRDADFTERFNNYNKPLVTSGRIGNPDLEAEHSFSYEAGADYFLTTGLKITAGFFQRYHSNLIDYVTTPYSQIPRKDNLSPTGTYAFAKNIARVLTSGVETEIQFSKQLENRQQIWATAGFVWLKSKNSDATPSFYISSHARYLTNFNILYLNKQFSFSINGLYKKRQPQSANADVIAKVSENYFILNAKAERFLWRNRLSAFIQTDNLFDKKYTDLLGALMPGRWFMGGIKITLSN